MAWILAIVFGLESTATIPHLYIYVLYYSVKGKIIFYWSKIISYDISFQISNLKIYNKFYMYAYLVFTIVYCRVFQGLNIERQVDSKIDPIHT